MKTQNQEQSDVKPKVEHTPTCTRWPGAHDDNGYGRVMSAGKWRPAHRVFWENKFGPLPKGMVLDHLCRTRDCINVDHLEIVTPKENTLRGVNPCAVNARRKVCVHGHELTGANVRIRFDGHRECIPCSRRRINAYGKKRRAAQAIAKAEGKE